MSTLLKKTSKKKLETMLKASRSVSYVDQHDQVKSHDQVFIVNLFLKDTFAMLKNAQGMIEIIEIKRVYLSDKIIDKSMVSQFGIYQVKGSFNEFLKVNFQVSSHNFPYNFSFQNFLIYSGLDEKEIEKIDLTCFDLLLSYKISKLEYEYTLQLNSSDDFNQKRILRSKIDDLFFNFLVLNHENSQWFSFAQNHVDHETKQILLSMII